jgi:hypothetical protein
VGVEQQCQVAIKRINLIGNEDPPHPPRIAVHLLTPRRKNSRECVRVFVQERKIQESVCVSVCVNIAREKGAPLRFAMS